MLILPRVVMLMGPTASGKTALGVEIAKALDGEVISVDSALVYRGMDIGTAKPDLAERQGVKHHLIDILDPSESFSAGQFREQALGLINEVASRGKMPILVGGTMLYFHVLLNLNMKHIFLVDSEFTRMTRKEYNVRLKCFWCRVKVKAIGC